MERRSNTRSTLAGRQPAPFDIGVFLSLADAQPWHAGGVSKERQDDLLPSLRTLFKSWPAWRAQLAPGADQDLLRAYYLLALDCTRRTYQGDGDVPPWQPPAHAPPLLRYRAAVCPLSLDRQALEQIVASAPPFAEARLFLGELALSALTLRTAEKHLAEAVRAMPELPPAWLLLGHVHLAIEELDLARDAYHRVNAAVPGQRDAMLGEAKSLSYLGRHEAAIAILDEAERLGTLVHGGDVLLAGVEPAPARAARRRERRRAGVAAADADGPQGGCAGRVHRDRAATRWSGPKGSSAWPCSTTKAVASGIATRATTWRARW